MTRACSSACGFCGRCDVEPEPSLPRAADRSFDAAVRTVHAWDAHQVDRVLAYLLTMPKAIDAKRYIERILHEARLQAVQSPDLILEMEVRKQLAAQDDPAAA